MKKIILLLFILCSGSNLFCQIIPDSTYEERTALTDSERYAINYMIEVYKDNMKVDPECDDCYDYVVDVFSKIDTLDRLYWLDSEGEKFNVAGKFKIKMNREEGGYFGDDIDITFEPDFSLKRGFIKMVINYPAAGVSTATIKFVLSGDVYEMYDYFTNHGGGHESFKFKVNGVVKYEGDQTYPYENPLY